MLPAGDAHNAHVQSNDRSDDKDYRIRRSLSGFHGIGLSGWYRIFEARQGFPGGNAGNNSATESIETFLLEHKTLSCIPAQASETTRH